MENPDRDGFYGVSVFVTQPSAVVALLRDHPMASRCDGKPVRVSRVATLLAVGCPLLLTGVRPHCDVVLPDLSASHLLRPRGCFDGPLTAPPQRLPRCGDSATGAMAMEPDIAVDLFKVDEDGYV